MLIFSRRTIFPFREQRPGLYKAERTMVRPLPVGGPACALIEHRSLEECIVENVLIDSRWEITVLRSD